jgi:hypothetical protein
MMDAVKKFREVSVVFRSYDDKVMDIVKDDWFLSGNPDGIAKMRAVEKEIRDDRSLDEVERKKLLHKIEFLASWAIERNPGIAGAMAGDPLGE